MLVCFRHMLLDIGPSIGVWAPLGATPLKTTDFLFPRSHHLSIAPQLEWELRTPPLNAKMLVSLILCGASAGNAVVEVRMCKSPAKSQRHCFVPSLCLESLYPIFLHGGMWMHHLWPVSHRHLDYVLWLAARDCVNHHLRYKATSLMIAQNCTNLWVGG